MQFHPLTPSNFFADNRLRGTTHRVNIILKKGLLFRILLACSVKLLSVL